MQYSWFVLKSRDITLMINVHIVKAMASLVAQLVMNLPAIQETPVWFLVGRSPGGGISYPLQYSWASLVAQLVKNVPAMQETWVWSLGQKDPLEKETATHSHILAWRISWTVWGHKELDMTEQFSHLLVFPVVMYGYES